MRPDAMKVDIQGAEGLFLQGAQQTITTYKPTILMEINRDMLAILSKTTPGDIYRHLAGLGYSIWSTSVERVTQVETAAELDLHFSAGRVANILAIHADRFGEVRERIQAFGVEMAGKPHVPIKAMKSEKSVKAKVKRSRVKETAL